jgi:Fic family protein
MPIIHYKIPQNWIKYDPVAISKEFVEAKAAILSLRMIPYQRDWVESLQQIELKREVAGTSRIEGAVFTDRELEAALKETPEQLETRSQRQAHAAVNTYRWIAGLPPDMPINADLVKAIHYRIVRGADDDHCQPGQLRRRDENVTFGSPRHRGVEGGGECEAAFTKFSEVIQRQYAEHDPLLQALAAHYHLAAMHPFLDGNGRTARALEALFLQRAGLRDTCFIAMSNYYYDEKAGYLDALNEVRSRNHDLTPFLVFSLRGIATQSRRLLNEIQRQNSKALFRNMMYDLFSRLNSPRKRVIAKRQIAILKLLLEHDAMDWNDFLDKIMAHYSDLGKQRKAIIRDVNGLISLRAVQFSKVGDRHVLSVRLEWPSEITETEFFEQINKLPKAKTYSFLP